MARRHQESQRRLPRRAFPAYRWNLGQLSGERRFVGLLTALLTLQLLVWVSSAVPLEKRQTWSSLYSYDLWNYGCRPVIFIFCRETIAPGNMGITVGPALANDLKAYFGAANVAAQGVDYLALPITNYLDGGAPQYGIQQMELLLAQATELCPNSSVVASGYSQGAAVTHRAIENLPQDMRDKIVGVVTFGDTQNLQDGGQIWGYPLNKTLIICNQGDVICAGNLWLEPPHFNYMIRVPEAATFLISRILIAAAQKAGAEVGDPTVSQPLTSFHTRLPPPPTFSPMPTSPLRPSHITQRPAAESADWPLPSSILKQLSGVSSGAVNAMITDAPKIEGR